MDSFTLLIIALVAAIFLLVGGVLGWVFAHQQRTKRLRQQFGSEYEQVVSEVGDRSEAEEELEARQKRVNSFDIRPLSPEEREQFVEEWQSVQARFVDEPDTSVQRANRLITEVMRTRGYPMVNFEQRAADLSVNYGEVVKNYRAGHDIARRSEQEEAGTEELRQAMVHYRALFAELIEVQEFKEKEAIAT
jgi:cytoskeletal protein RodZ